jgi:hypothetical protein
MARFKQTLPDNAFDILWKECQVRNIPRVQELIRSVIVPDWVKKNIQEKTIAPAESGDTADAEAAAQ